MRPQLALNHDIGIAYCHHNAAPGTWSEHQSLFALFPHRHGQIHTAWSSNADNQQWSISPSIGVPVRIINASNLQEGDR
jgi:hypothetical protein